MAIPPKKNKNAKAIIKPMTQSISVPLAQFFLWILEPSPKAQTSSIIIPMSGREEIKMVSAHSLGSRGRLSSNVCIKLVFKFEFHE